MNKQDQDQQIFGENMTERAQVGDLQTIIKICMDKEKEISGNLNCIEVKGMNNHSQQYIKRFFSRAGTVQDVKKQEDRVIVKFKHKASMNRVHQFNWGNNQKHSIKIRQLNPQHAIQTIPCKRKHANYSTISQPTKEETAKFDYNKYQEKIQYGPLDVPYHWAQVMKILDVVEDYRARWIMHQLFALELTQALHYNFFKQNSRSSYYYLTIKELFLGRENKKDNSCSGENSVDKFQIFSQIPNDLQYEPSYQLYASDLENKVRKRLSSFRNYGVGQRALHLYSILYRNALILSEECIFLSTGVVPEDKKEFKKIQLQKNTNQHIQISVQEWPNFFQRSQYRIIDEEHPSKQIEVHSDSVFHENSQSITLYDIFKDGFDGTMNNNCAADIFYELKPYYSPNYLLIRHIQGQIISYKRLDFELRILNASSETFSTSDYNRIYSWSRTQGFEQEEQIKMCKHNLVLSSFDNPQKVLYLINNYLKYFCEKQNSTRSSSESADSSEGLEYIVNVISIVNKPCEQNNNYLNQLFDKIFQDQTVRKRDLRLYIITIQNDKKFQELKCKNFIQNYVDNLEIELTVEMSKHLAKTLVDKHPDKFKKVRNPRNFAEQTLWGTFLMKSKRKAKNKKIAKEKDNQSK